MANEMQCCPVCGKLARIITKISGSAGSVTVIRHQSKKLKDCIQKGEEDDD